MPFCGLFADNINDIYVEVCFVNNLYKYNVLQAISFVVAHSSTFKNAIYNIYYIPIIELLLMIWADNRVFTIRLHNWRVR